MQQETDTEGKKGKKQIKVQSCLFGSLEQIQMTAIQVTQRHESG